MIVTKHIVVVNAKHKKCDLRICIPKTMTRPPQGVIQKSHQKVIIKYCEPKIRTGRYLSFILFKEVAVCIKI